MVGKYILALLIALPFAVRIGGQELLPQRNQIPPAPDWVSKLDQGLYSVAWAPNSQLVAFGGRGTVRVCRVPNFAVEQTLETGQEEIWGLAWSPDGTKIIFAHRSSTGADQNAHLYEMNADGSGLVQITRNPFWQRQPAWGPRP